VLKNAVLLVHYALPKIALEAEKDWGKNFSGVFIYSVKQAEDAVMLMECLGTLEHGIRSGWLDAQVVKAQVCIASRLVSFRTATYSSIAIRLQILDAAIKYDKLVETR
jgi:hypothetical protein